MVAMLASQLGRELGLSREHCSELFFAAVLSDMGMVGLAEDAWENPTPTLSPEVRQRVQLHPQRSEEQVRFMQALWAKPHVTFNGEFHQLDDGGINPRPRSGKVPVWFGGHAEATFRRTARYGDGFMPLAYPAGDEALKAFDKLRTLIKAEGRDPASVGLEWGSSRWKN